MKQTLLAPAVFLLSFIFSVLAIGVPTLLVLGSLGGLIGRIGTVLFAALLLSALYVIIRGVTMEISPFFYLVIAFFTTLLFLGGIIFLDNFVLQKRMDDPAFDRPFPIGTLLRGPERSIYIDSAQGVSLSDVVVISPEELPKIRVYTEGVWRNDVNEIVPIGGPDAESFSLAEIESIRWRRLPESLTSIVSDVRELYLHFRSGLHGGEIVLWAVHLGAFLFAMTLMWTTARISRWSLFNLLLTVAYLRGLLAIPELIVRVRGTFEIPSWLPQVITANLLPVAWGVIGLILLVVAILLPSMREWRREVFGEGQG